MGLARVSVTASAHCGGQGRDHGNSCWDFLLHDDSCIKGRVQDSALVSRELLQAPWHAHPLSDSWRRLQGAEGDPSLHPQTTAPKARMGRLDIRTWGPSRSCMFHMEQGFQSQGRLLPSRAGPSIPGL